MKPHIVLVIHGENPSPQGTWSRYIGCTGCGQTVEELLMQLREGEKAAISLAEHSRQMIACHREAQRLGLEVVGQASPFDGCHLEDGSRVRSDSQGKVEVVGRRQAAAEDRLWMAVALGQQGE